MSKTILITGSTDGIGLDAAMLLARQGHKVLLHGRNRARLEAAVGRLRDESPNCPPQAYLADLSAPDQVVNLAAAVARDHKRLDVLINNAGVLKTPDPHTRYGWDLRLMVNTIAPYLLTRRLLPSMDHAGRVINVASAAQEPVDLQALQHPGDLSDMSAYAQSKLALIMWTFHLARTLGEGTPAFIAVNPGSLLGTKMVREGFGLAGKDVHIGGDILARLATDEAFSSASGQYFDNDVGDFGSPHPDALDPERCRMLTEALDVIVAQLT